MDRPVRYIPEVSLGALLQMGTVLVSIATFYAYVTGDIHEGELARAKYIPIIDRLVQSEPLQDERILNLAQSQTDIRRSIDLISDKLNSISIELADIKARLPERHSEVERTH
jgi:hypothetical protein